MKKSCLLLLGVIFIILIANPATANTVTFYFDDPVASGYTDIISMQMDFDPLDPGAENPFTWDVSLTAGPGVAYDSKSNSGKFLDLSSTGDYATGLVVTQKYNDRPFHDGLMFTLAPGEYADPFDVAIDLGSIMIFSAADTANPIPGLFISEEWIGADQIVTISATDPGPGPVVPIPASVFLLGGGLLGPVRHSHKRIVVG